MRDGDRTFGVCSMTGVPAMIIQFSTLADSLLSLIVLCVFFCYVAIANR